MSLLSRRMPSDMSLEKSSVDATSSSLLYSIIPTRISDRISRLPSIRSSPSLRRSRSQKHDSPAVHPAPSSCYTTAASTSSSGTSTPPPAYAPGSSMIRTGHDTEDSMSTFSFDTSPPRPQTQSLYRASSHHPSPSLTSLAPSQQLQPSESESGIIWKFATQGASLLSLSLSESSSPSASNADPTLARQLYIHALTYLIRGLPTDLSPEEHLSVRASLPSGVVQPINVSLTQNQHLHITNGAAAQQTEGGQRQRGRQRDHPSVLHRMLAAVVLWSFHIFQLMLPFLKGALKEAYLYERKWRISEKVVGRGLDVVDGLGKGGWGVMERVGGMGDGKVGKLFGEMVMWGVEGVVGGVGEGVVEGMGLLGGRGKAPFRE